MAKQLEVVVVTPERTVVQQTAEMVVLPLFDGELGVLPGRSRMIGRLDFGELRIKQGATTTRWYVDGGFAQIANDVVAILTGRVIKAQELDANTLSQQLDEVERKRPGTVEGNAARDRAIRQMRAQLRVVEKG